MVTDLVQAAIYVKHISYDITANTSIWKIKPVPLFIYYHDQISAFLYLIKHYKPESSEPALNLTDFLAGVSIVFFVCGLTLLRAALSDTENVPNPTRATLLPFLTSSDTEAKNASRPFFASAFVRPDFDAITHATMFDMTQPQCNEWIHRLSDILYKTLKSLGELPDRNHLRVKYLAG